MPEPIAIASAVSAVVVNGIKLCLSVYGTIDGMKQAPKHLKAVSSDLKAFYGILGTIQIYLDDQELTQGLLHTQPSDNLQTILANCVCVLQDFEKIVSGYIKAGQESSFTKWEKVCWTWKLADVENLRKHLSDHKASLSVAIGMANLIINNDMASHASSSRMAADMQEMREVSARIEIQWADTRAELVALIAKLSHQNEMAQDGDVIMQNQRATIRAFAQDADSIMTSSLMEPACTPSFQVSAHDFDSARSISFVTACTSRATGQPNFNDATEDGSRFRYGHQLVTAVSPPLNIPPSRARRQLAARLVQRKQAAEGAANNNNTNAADSIVVEVAHTLPGEPNELD